MCMGLKEAATCKVLAPSKRLRILRAAILSALETTVLTTLDSTWSRLSTAPQLYIWTICQSGAGPRGFSFSLSVFGTENRPRHPLWSSEMISGCKLFECSYASVPCTVYRIP